MTRRSPQLRRLGPLRKRRQPERVLREHGIAGALAGFRSGAVVALARASRFFADG